VQFLLWVSKTVEWINITQSFSDTGIGGTGVAVLRSDMMDDDVRCKLLQYCISQQVRR